MKKIILICLGLFFAGAINAQDEDVSGVAKKMPKSERMIISIYQDLWQDAPDGIKVNPVNLGFSFSAMMDYPIKTSNFSIAPGIGISTHNFRSNAYLSNEIDAATDQLTGNSVFTKYDSLKYDVNKFSVGYLDIPFEIRYKTKHEKKSKQFKIAVGAKAGLMLSNHTKYKGKDPADKITDTKLKKYDYNNVEKYRYGLTFRVGRGPWNIMGYYSLSKIFEDGKGIEMYPISIGIAITPF